MNYCCPPPGPVTPGTVVAPLVVVPVVPVVAVPVDVADGIVTDVAAPPFTVDCVP
jgi:hypothetical protein